MNQRLLSLAIGAKLQGQGGIAFPNFDLFHLGRRAVIAGHCLDPDVSIIFRVIAGYVVGHFVSPSKAECVICIPVSEKDHSRFK
jgi:hypothetical protein